MKSPGMLLLILGVGICAAFGSKLPDEVHKQQALLGAANVYKGATNAALETYCQARSANQLERADGCPPDDPKEAASEKQAAVKQVALDRKAAAGKEAPPAPTPEEVKANIATAQAALKLERENVDPAVAKLPEVLKLHGAWLDAKEKAIGPSAQASTIVILKPWDRFTNWFGSAGLFFGIGLVLIAVGGVMSRIAAKKEALSEDGDGENAVDFGALLGSLKEDIDALIEEMKAIRRPSPEDMNRIKERIEVLQNEKFQRLVGARMRVQMLYGLASFAAIFSPFSAAERKVNRTWSALVDKHWGESNASLQSASLELGVAIEEMDRAVATQQAAA